MVRCFVLFYVAVSPTSLTQFKLPGPNMMRSNSIPAQDSSFDLYDDSQLCGSATSLEERPRAISHSGSFRDSMEEGKRQLTKKASVTYWRFWDREVLNLSCHSAGKLTG